MSFGASDEDPSGGFRSGGWVVPYADEDFGGIVDSWFSKAGKEVVSTS